MNAGPALLQKAIILAACSLESMPCLYSCAVFCAPIGYPPRKLTARRDSVPFGTLHKAVSGLRTGRACPARDDVRKIDSMMNGKRDGINVAMHKFRPSDAPRRTFLLSSIKISMPAAAMTEANTFRLLKITTSKNSMQSRKS